VDEKGEKNNGSLGSIKGGEFLH